MSGALGNTLDPSNHDSPIGAIGGQIQKYTDPIAWIPGLGDKWVDLTSHKIPKMLNTAISPVTQAVGQVDKTINPLRKIGFVDNVMNTVEAKPADAIGLAIGSYFAAPAIAAAAGGGGAGAGGAGAAGAGIGESAGTAAGLGAAEGAGTAGATGVTGFLGGPAALGDAGLTGTVSASGSGLGAASAGEMGGALGSAPTGLFSGLLPGGGMTGTASGALGGGLSGATAGGSSLGGASMGGFLNSPMAGKLTNYLENQAISQGTQAAQGQQQPARYQPQNFAHSSFRAPNTASYMPTSAITTPYTLGGGGVQSLLQQMMLQRQNPLG
jgi:hypothetical protein